MYEIFEQLLQLYDVTPYQVAKAIGVSQSTFSNWKARRNIISPRTAKLIADYFGVSVDYLLTGKETSDADFTLSSNNAVFLANVQKRTKDSNFVNVLMKYMSLNPADANTVNDMIDFLYSRAQKKEVD